MAVIPINSVTSIRFTIPQESRVILTIYNTLGELVRSFEGYYPPGHHAFTWEGRNMCGNDVASGVYLYRLAAGECQETKKMVLLK
ncbi:MAG: FlgD immunoglobulin-like domain containing protein [Candidatus Zixiibacteriota bacterium]